VLFLLPALAAAQDAFRPATFHGLTIGKAKIADVKRELGNPVEQTDDRHGSIYMFYKDIGPVPGTVEIGADKNTQLVGYVAVYPDNLSLDAAKELFGSGFRIMRYAFDMCLDKGGEGPIYESRNGSLEFVVYPALGIAIYPEQGRARDITYNSKPLGRKEFQCKGKPPRN
jgi:hypothetical protein